MAYTTIKKPSDYFNTKLYTGNQSTNVITGVGFQPDLVWIKNRGFTDKHWLNDAVRGSTKGLHSNLTNAESTASNSITSFDSDGFTLGNLAETNGNQNNNVAWNWLGANGTASNTDGSITSTVSANTTSGFSIVSYTGTGANATVGHGLGVAPSMIINKCRSAGQNWATYHASLGGTKALFLDGTGAAATSSSYFNNTDPTSSVFSVGNSGDTNLSSGTHISYCFAEKQGFSKFGSYTGNGNADGPFIYTGFKPAFVMIKSSSQAETNWVIVDNKREGYNPDNDRLFPDSNQVESTSDVIDLLSNGFKLISGAGSSNGPSYTHIYMAFAEEPLVGDNPATAR